MSHEKVEDRLLLLCFPTHFFCSTPYFDNGNILSIFSHSYKILIAKRCGLPSHLDEPPEFFHVDKDPEDPDGPVSTSS
jgi:hypothetical protein